MDPTQLQPYEYCPLEDAGRDIRIVEVLPGQFDDDLRVQIHHEPLLEPPEVADTRMTLPQLKATLPERWDACINPEGKYLFYNPDEAALVWEHPDAHVDKATYELPTHDEKFDPHYEALSYVWGSDQKPHHLIVESGRACTRIPVTDSLMTALRHLRRPEESRRLWVDAVCINQSDSVELGSQVQRMGLIYKLAYRVVVWLGPQNEDSAHALATLDYLGAQIEVDGSDHSVLPAPFAEQPTWRQHLVPLPYSQDTWNAILALLLRPWFHRVWTLQEIQLGSKRPGPIFQCGTETIDVSRFYRAVSCLSSKSILSTDVQMPRLEQLIISADVMLEPMVGWNLWDVLRRGTLGRRCQDGRDKVYGAIGLLPKRFASKIKVDYGRDNTAGQVYKKTFLAHAQHVERLELFPDCYITGRSIPDAPSWVPDWYWKGPGESYHRPQYATGTSRAHFKYNDEEPDLLEILGVRCAEVSHVSDYLPARLERQDAIDHVRQWQPRNLDTDTYTPTGEPLRKAYACTLIENTVIERSSSSRARAIWTEEWVNQGGPDSLFGDSTGSPTGSEGSDSMKLDEAINMALLNCYDRAFVQTHEGYIGLAPAETRPGDVVAIFLGCYNPLVLRPEQGRYSIVGESFVYALEDAIKLLGPLPEPWRPITQGTSRGPYLHYFFDPRTMELTREDPRLEPLHKWSRIDREPDGDDPINFDFFEHEDTGVVVNYDPRLEPEMLEKRGVQLERFILV